MDNRLEIFCGNSNPALANEIAANLGINIGDSIATTFSDGEIQVKINETVRGADVFVIQSTCDPVNDNMMELLIMMDAFKRASANRITAVVPYYGYARQDRKARPRDPITAKLVADIITAAGANRVLTMDLHTAQIQGYFDFPVDHLKAVPILVNYFKGLELEDVVVVSPDLGGVPRARGLAYRLGAPIAIVDKRRPEPNVAEIMNLIGDVRDKNVIMADDMIDTAGTITLGAQAIMDHGAKNIYVCCTHPVFSGPAIERLEKAPIKEIVVTNTIPLNESKKLDNIKVLSVAPLFSEAIRRIHDNIPVSPLFD